MKKLLVLLIVLGLAGVCSAAPTVYYVDVTTGSDSDNGTTEALAWQTFDKACRSVGVGTGNGEIVYVKASAPYTSVDTNDSIIDINDAGAIGAPVVFIGYFSTINDGGVVEVNSATTTNAYCVTSNNLGSLYYVFVNFRFVGATSDGVRAGFTAGADDYIAFANCKFDNNGANGFLGDQSVCFVNCLFRDNVTNGITMGASGMVDSCIFYSNGAAGVSNGSSPLIIGSLFSENITNQIILTGTSGPAIITRCTFDGNDVANNDGIDYAGNTGQVTVITDCIFYDCAKGVNCGYDKLFRIDRNNCYYSCGAANTYWPDPTDADAVLRNTFTASSDPFVSVGSITAYVLAGNTPNTGAKYGALDAGHCAAFWSSYASGTNPPTGANAAAGYNDIGAKQRVDPAGGGGGQKILGGGVVR